MFAARAYHSFDVILNNKNLMYIVVTIIKTETAHRSIIFVMLTFFNKNIFYRLKQKGNI